MVPEVPNRQSAGLTVVERDGVASHVGGRSELPDGELVGLGQDLLDHALLREGPPRLEDCLLEVVSARSLRLDPQGERAGTRGGTDIARKGVQSCPDRRGVGELADSKGEECVRFRDEPDGSKGRDGFDKDGEPFDLDAFRGQGLPRRERLEVERLRDEFDQD